MKTLKAIKVEDIPLIYDEFLFQLSPIMIKRKKS
jgi:hypothetical protein